MHIDELMGLIEIELQKKSSPLTRMPDSFRLGSNGPLHSASRRAARRAASAVSLACQVQSKLAPAASTRCTMGMELPETALRRADGSCLGGMGPAGGGAMS